MDALRRDRTVRGALRLSRAVFLAGVAACHAALARAQPAPGVTDTVHVRQHELTLEEIIARCIQGEKSKLGGHSNMTCKVSVRVLALWKKKKEIDEVVLRHYADVQGFSRVVSLGEKHEHFELEGEEWVPKPKKDEKKMNIQVESGGYGDFVDLPFFLEDQQEYDFKLLDRTVEMDHVIFKVGFRPRSNFKPLPSGTVYVDTNHYRIVHEEFTFEKNPFPLMLKKVTKVSRHWEELPGGEWVYTRILVDAEPREWFGALPDRVEVAVMRQDFKFDKGYDARVFGKR
jgi:hypothetical protein